MRQFFTQGQRCPKRLLTVAIRFHHYRFNRLMSCVCWGMVMGLEAHFRMADEISAALRNGAASLSRVAGG